MKKDASRTDKDRKNEICLVAIVVSAIILATMAYCFVHNLGKYNNANDVINSIRKYLKVFFDNINNSKIDIYIAQLSLTFITISLTSVLSDKSVTLYWKNLVEEVLVRPRFRCFYAFVLYSFGTIIVSTTALLFGYIRLMFFAFLVNIFVLSCLTFSMMNVYFARSKQKDKLIAEYEKKQDRKKEWLIQLKEYTIKAMMNKDVEIVNENIEFYIEYCDYSDIEYLMISIENNNVEYAKKIIKGFSNRINKEIIKNESTLDWCMEKWDVIYMLPDKMLNDIINNAGILAWNDLYETIMIESRNILVQYFNTIFGKKINIKDFKSYNEFRFV